MYQMMAMSVFTFLSRSFRIEEKSHFPLHNNLSIFKLDFQVRNKILGTSLVVQCIRLCAPNAGGPGLIPGWGTRSRMHAAIKSWHAATKKQLNWEIGIDIHTLLIRCIK